MKKQTKTNKINNNGTMKVFNAEIGEKNEIICPECGSVNKFYSPYDCKLIQKAGKNYYEFFRMCKECSTCVRYLMNRDLTERIKVNDIEKMEEIVDEESK